MKKTLSLLTFIIIALLSCKKKEDYSNTIPTSLVNNTAKTGNWKVTYYWDTNKDETSNFAGYTFNFRSDSIVNATKSTTGVSGIWYTGIDDSKTKLFFTFNSPADFVEIADDWHVIECTDTKIKLQDVSGGNGGTDYLTFEKM